MGITRRGRWQVEDFSQHNEIDKAFSAAQTKANELQRPIEITPCIYIAEPDVVEVFETIPSTAVQASGSYTIIVDPATGDDTNTYAQVTGDPTTYRWATVCKACWGVAPASWDGSTGDATNAAKAGDTVLVYPGTYSIDRGGSTSSSAPTYKAINSGSAGSPIIFKAQYPAVFNASNLSKLEHTNGHSYLIDLSGTYVYFDGFYCDEDNAPGASGNGFIQLGSGTRGGIVNCDILGMSSSANANHYYDNHGLIFASRNTSGDTKLICNNKFHRSTLDDSDPSYPGNGDPNEGSIILYDQVNLHILHNEFYDVTGGGVFWKDQDVSQHGGIVAFNSFHDLNAPAIDGLNSNVSQAVNDTLVYQNLIYNVTTPIRFDRAGANCMTGFSFVNNTIDQLGYDSTWWDPLAIRYGGVNIPANTVFRNNLITNISASSFGDPSRVSAFWTDTVTLATLEAVSGLDIDRNYYADVDSGNPMFVASASRTLAYWQDTGSGFDNNGAYNSVATAIYTDAANGDFTLAASSPALTAQSGPGQDYLQLLGGLSTAGIDCGAYITGISEIPGLESGYSYTWHTAGNSIP